MNNQFNFSCSSVVIKPDGKLVYEYNPLYNYRTNKEIYAMHNGQYVDKNGNLLYCNDAEPIVGESLFYYIDTNGDKQVSYPALEENGILLDLVTGIQGTEDVLNFDLTHPVDIQCQQSYDGSVNLILNDNKNIPRLINTRFTPKENNTYTRVDRKGNTDTNIYDKDEFDIDASLFKKYNSIPKIKFQRVSQGGNLKIGQYTFYFKLADADTNETDFIGESGMIPLHIGALNDPSSIRGGSSDENSNKSVHFSINNIDTAYDYVYVYYTRSTGTNISNTFNTLAYKIDKKYRINNGICIITINGDEEIITIPLSEINTSLFIASKARTQAICQNRLFLGNVTKSDVNYEELTKLSQRFIPYYVKTKQDNLIGCLQYDYLDAFGKYEYYNIDNVYNYTGYWPEEMYRFGVVYIMEDNLLSPVFNIRGIKDMPNYNTEDCPYTDYDKIHIDSDTQYINKSTLENSAGVVQFPKMEIDVSREGIYDKYLKDNTINGNLSVYGLQIRHQKCYDLNNNEINILTDELKKLKVKGYFFVRQKRIPTILAQAFTMGVDPVSGLPLLWQGKEDNEDLYTIESFVNPEGKLSNIPSEKMIVTSKAHETARIGICPEYELNLSYFNNLFTDSYFIVKPITEQLSVCQEGARNFFTNWNNSLIKIDTQEYYSCKIVSIVDGSPAVKTDSCTFRAKAGNAEDLSYEYIESEETEKNIPTKDNFSHEIRHHGAFSGVLGVLKVVAIAAAVVVGVVASIFTGGTSLVAAAGATGAILTIGAGVAAGGACLAAATAMKSSYTTGGYGYTDNRVKITRGLYGPYLGLTDAANIKPSLLINIYIPGYYTQSSQDLFDLRIQDESPYYSISLRYLINRDNSDEITLYRGDCYISTFSHRINRNFLDPDAPYNDKIISESTWIDKWDKDKRIDSEVNRGDVNAVKMGTWITFKCYSSMNLAFRDWDASYPSEEIGCGHKRTFYPLSSMSVEGNSKIPESSCYNAGFSVSTPSKVNYIVPNVPFIKNCFLTRIMYSNVAATDAFKNGFREFELVSYQDYPNLYGGLMKLISWNGNLIAIFEHGIGLIPINEKTLLSADENQIAVGAAKIMSETMLMISDMYGTLWPESICCSEKYIYGIDTIAKKIWKIDGRSINIISDFKVLKFLNDNITLTERELTPIIGIRNVKTHYNAYKKDIMFTYYDNKQGFEEVVWNLCYNEIQEMFTTFYSWIPSYSANIDNMFFSYDRNSSKWIAKLGASSATKDADGVCMNTINIDEWLIDGEYKIKLDIKNKPLPNNFKTTFTLERDNFLNYKYFEIITDTDNDQYLKLTDYTGLLNKMLSADPIVPVILLNISCSITAIDTNNQATAGGDWKDWEKYLSYNYGMYQCQVAITFNDVINTSKSKLPKLTTDFWKHGLAGIIDIQEEIKPCYWYGKQHPFEFEFIVGNNSPIYKQFTNLSIISNNVCPESIHYSIIGDTYDFADDKENMYFRLEATKALYQYNGSDILYDHDFVNITPKQVFSSNYIELDLYGNYLRNSSAVSSVYKATVFPLIYARQDTFNEVEDYYKTVTAPFGKDYNNLSGCEIIKNKNLSYNYENHVKIRDVKTYGIIRGNAKYSNDRWDFLISPIVYYQINENWINNVPTLLAYNIPQNIFKFNTAWEIDLNSSDLKQAGYVGLTQIDLNNWEEMSNKRKECKLMDKYIKIRLRYPGDRLALILAMITNYNTFN